MPAASTNPTLGEIGRLIEAMREEQRDFRAEVNSKFTEFGSTYVRRETFDAIMLARSEYVKGVEDRVSKLEANQAWIVRIVISTVVLALIGGLFAASKAVGA